MNSLARLAGFAATLALVGGGAAAIGAATGASPPFRSCLIPVAEGAAMGSGHGGEPMAEVVAGSDGTHRELDGVTLEPIGRAPAGGRASTWRFTVTDCEGHAITSFQRDQTKLLHLIVARTDMTGYQHLHPTLGADGHWSVDVRFAEPGSYRAIADFTTGGRRYVLGSTIDVPGTATPVALPAPSTAASTDGYDVTLRRPAVLKAGREAELSFTVTRHDRPVTDLQPYLGAYGHLVALHAGDLAYSHVHPVGEDRDAGTITFDAELHKAGSYRLFVQFRAGGRVHTAAFTQEVSR